MRVKNIFKRLFRVYAHMYHSHVESIIALGAEAHLNTCFKHFMYFILEFGLVERKELEPLVEICMVRRSLFSFFRQNAVHQIVLAVIIIGCMQGLGMELKTK